MLHIQHNLPNQPYKQFFGRTDSLKKIQETLVEGGTFIASIDGVGGIGKTALAYHFCKEMLMRSRKFSYIVWITSKNTVFDAFSLESSIKRVENPFKGIETLIDTTLSVVGFEEMIGEDLEYKKDFFENTILESEKIFFVIDNLETILFDDFFEYITKTFNKFSSRNKNIKILTTSRKRKKIADFPIEIEGLNLEDSLSMLKFLAREYNIKSILNASDLQHTKIIDRVGRIPLGIEFIVGQMSLGKSLGQIYKELEGYPSLEGIDDEFEKRSKLSSIIAFSFKDMYETLDNDHQKVFQTIAALQKNKHQGDDDISLELILSLTNLSKNKIETITENLIDNKLITERNNIYSLSQMAINFARQFFDEFDNFENEIIGRKERFSKNSKKSDKVDLLIENSNSLNEQNKYDDAEKFLLDILDTYNDPRIYYELAKVQRILNKFSNASDNFKMATTLDQNNPKIWFDWINMNDNRQMHNIAIKISLIALKHTNYNISIVLQLLGIYKFKRDYTLFRDEARRISSILVEQERPDDYIKLLRYWKTVEYGLNKENIANKYIEIAEQLATEELDKELSLQILKELLKVLKKNREYQMAHKIENKINRLESQIKQSIHSRVKKLNILFSQKSYDDAEKECKKILHWYDPKNVDDIPYFQNAIRLLLQILISKRDYNKVISNFIEYHDLAYSDENCIQINEKAKKLKLESENNEIISNININIQSIENNIRKIIMFSLENSDDNLLSLLQKKSKNDWINSWLSVRNKALSSDLPLINYSDISHLRSILSWQKKTIESFNIKIQPLLHKSTFIIEEYYSQERNEAFHSRLQHNDKNQLNTILSDMQRLKDYTDSILNLLI